MSTLRFATTVPALLRGARDLLVVAPASALTEEAFPAVLDEDLVGLLLELAEDLEPGDLGACASTLTGVLPRRLVLGVLPDGVSRHNAPSRAECIRRVASDAKLSGPGKSAVLLVLDEPEHLLAAANAVGRALPVYARKSISRKVGAVQLLGVDRDGNPLKADRRVRETVEAAREVARLVDTPAAELTPRAMAREARRMLKDLPGVRLREIAGPALLKAGFGGVHGVGRAAQDPPRVLIASYAPAGRRKGPHVALVGKGICYDTGGLSLKVGGNMVGMKGDMGGAGAVLGAFRTLVADRCRKRLTLILCLAENAIGPTSYRPDDILVMHSKKTVEINNTDAEGRLLLADGVSYAARVAKADVVLDAATLTGAQLVATGLLHAAVVSNDAELEAAAVRAGQRSGDLTHPLPFAPELYKQEFKSEVADMKNSVKNRMNAQSSCAAQFVYWHIEDAGVRWCHVDMAGPARPGERASGYGVALLGELVRELA